jgi:outer membrane lipoprotein-sorting protein
MKIINVGMLFVFIFPLMIILAPLNVIAVTQDEKGLRIAKEYDRRNSGFINYEVNLKMYLKARSGKTRTRELHSKVLEVQNDGDKTLVVFDTPRDIRGTAFLSFTHKIRDDEQWLYLPALKRVKRIAPSNKSSPFMGSEFSYEDMSSQELEKFTYKWIKDEDLNGIECFVLERYPVEENSGYSKQVVWIDKSDYRIRKIDYYDRKGKYLKTLKLSNFKKYSGKFWKPIIYEMANHKTGKNTRLEFSDYRFGIDLEEKDFTQSSLRRAR